MAEAVVVLCRKCGERPVDEKLRGKRRRCRKCHQMEAQARIARWRKTPNGRVFLARHGRGQNARAANRKYQRSPRGKTVMLAVWRRYSATEKGRARHKRANMKRCYVASRSIYCKSPELAAQIRARVCELKSDFFAKQRAERAAANL